MTDLSKLAAERCAELANGIRPNDKFWRAASFEQENGSSDMWSEGERRHEYDHHKGYAAEHHLSVEPVCTICHHARESARG